VKNIIFTIMILLFVSVSCTSNHIIEHTDKYCEIVNRKFKEKQGLIKLIDGRIIKVQNINIMLDSIAVIELGLQKKHIFPISEIQSITFENRNKGAFQGMFISGLIGGTIGGFIGYVFGYSLTEYGDPVRAGMEALPKGFLIGAAFSGLVFGCPIGGSIGAKDRYIFNSLPDTANIKINDKDKK